MQGLVGEDGRWTYRERVEVGVFLGEDGGWTYRERVEVGVLVGEDGGWTSGEGGGGGVDREKWRMDIRRGWRWGC